VEQDESGGDAQELRPLSRRETKDYGQPAINWD
jgi:hypothetical protein